MAFSQTRPTFIDYLINSLSTLPSVSRNTEHLDYFSALLSVTLLSVGQNTDQLLDYLSTFPSVSQNTDHFLRYLSTWLSASQNTDHILDYLPKLVVSQIIYLIVSGRFFLWHRFLSIRIQTFLFITSPRCLSRYRPPSLLSFDAASCKSEYPPPSWLHSSQRGFL